MLQNHNIGFFSQSHREQAKGESLPYHYFSKEDAKISRIDHSLDSVKYLNFDDDIYGIRINDFKAYLND